MRLVIKQYNGVTNVSDSGSTLRKILYKRSSVSLYIKVLLYTVIKIVLMEQGFIQDLS